MLVGEPHVRRSVHNLVRRTCLKDKYTHDNGSADLVGETMLDSSTPQAFSAEVAVVDNVDQALHYHTNGFVFKLVTWYYYPCTEGPTVVHGAVAGVASTKLVKVVKANA